MKTSTRRSRRARTKGKRWEFELEDRLQKIYGEHVRRTPNVPSQDFENTDNVRIEAKAWKQPRFMDFIHKMRERATSPEWAIMWTGDRRNHLDAPIMLVDLEFGLILLEAWHLYREQLLLQNNNMARTLDRRPDDGVALPPV